MCPGWASGIATAPDPGDASGMDRGTAWVAAGWGLLGASSLVLGALLGLLVRWPPRVVALVLAFGSGTLISTVAFDLVEESWATSGGWVTGGALAAGALAFCAGDVAVSRAGVPRRRRTRADHSRATATVLVVGALLDGVPESAAIGATVSQQGVSWAFLAAVFLSNIPESLSSAVGMRSGGRPRHRILLLWVVIVFASGLAAALGYLSVAVSPPPLVDAIRSFAAGAVLTMVSSTMLPEAHEQGGPVTALLTTAGFLTAVALGHLQP